MQMMRLLSVCVVAQYTVLEANAKVSGRGLILQLHPFETHGPIWIPL